MVAGVDRKSRGGTRAAALLKSLLGAAFASASLFAAAPAFAQAAPACTRAGLQKAVDDYITTQTKGDTTLLRLGNWTQYSEQMEMASMLSGIISTPMKIDLHRSILDTQSCQTFTEVIVTDPKHPYVLGTRLAVRGDTTNEIEILVTDRDDWLFNAANTLKYSKAEKWDPIPEGDRDSRATLIAAANAYLDSFADKNVTVPWGSPCARLEGGLYTAKGAPGVASATDTCNVGVPANTKLVERRHIVDETLGAVAVLLRFGNNALPDSHLFRIEKGKIRYVHTITVCKTFNCGFPVPEALKTAAK